MDVDEGLNESNNEQNIFKPKMLTLTELINEIKLYPDDLECFKRLYKVLRREYSKYYIPFLKNPRKIHYLIKYCDEESLSQRQQFNMDFDQFNNRCKFVSGLRNLCFGIDLLLKFIGDKNENEKKGYQEVATAVLLKRIKIFFKTIKELSLKVIHYCTEYKETF